MHCVVACKVSMLVFKHECLVLVLKTSDCLLVVIISLCAPILWSDIGMVSGCP